MLAAAAPTAVVADGRAGRLARIETTAPSRSWIAPGRFVMGTRPDDLELLQAECELTRSDSLARALRDDPCLAWASVLAVRSPREVWLDGYWVDRREVTVREYRACVHAGGCALAPLVEGDPSLLADALPQVNVTRGEAERFCAWRGGRLPTEAEWEKAARGTDGRTWPWGDDRRHDAWNHGMARVPVMAELDQAMRPGEDNTRLLGDPDPSDGWDGLAPPGHERGSDSPYGVSDLAGNVAEWVADALSVDGFDGLSTTNPMRGPDPRRDMAMIRGGSWRDPTFLGRVDVPHYLSMFITGELRAGYVGFRCVYTRTMPAVTAVPMAPSPPPPPTP